MCGKVLYVNLSDKSYKLIAMHLVSIALYLVYSFDSYAHNAANYA